MERLRRRAVGGRPGRRGGCAGRSWSASGRVVRRRGGWSGAVRLVRRVGRVVRVRCGWCGWCRVVLVPGGWGGVVSCVRRRVVCVAACGAGGVAGGRARSWPRRVAAGHAPAGASSRCFSRGLRLAPVDVVGRRRVPGGRCSRRAEIGKRSGRSGRAEPVAGLEAYGLGRLAWGRRAVALAGGAGWLRGGLRERGPGALDSGRGWGRRAPAALSWGARVAASWPWGPGRRAGPGALRRELAGHGGPGPGRLWVAPGASGSAPDPDRVLRPGVFGAGAPGAAGRGGFQARPVSPRPVFPRPALRPCGCLPLPAPRGVGAPGTRARWRAGVLIASAVSVPDLGTRHRIIVVLERNLAWSSSPGTRARCRAFGASARPRARPANPSGPRRPRPRARPAPGAAGPRGPPAGRPASVPPRAPRSRARARLWPAAPAPRPAPAPRRGRPAPGLSARPPRPAPALGATTA
jgi:hypothetical protein